MAMTGQDELFMDIMTKKFTKEQEKTACDQCESHLKRISLTKKIEKTTCDQCEHYLEKSFMMFESGGVMWSCRKDRGRAISMTTEPPKSCPYWLEHVFETQDE